ncbi:MAG: 4Fe-4S binding protein [Eggerthellaceae bacterium]|nr:4Fe-4S binding protein [Eggerthellaceae bacterium]
MRYLRVGVALAVLVVVFACTFAHVPVGTLCALCPVGFAELSVASGSIPWELLPGVIVLLGVVFLLGRVFCSWVCPTSLVRNLFGGRAPRGLTGRTGSCAGCAGATAPEAAGTQAVSAADPNAARTRNNLLAQGLVLVVLLVVSFIVHFPVFCLFCPIGLAFGSLFAVSRLFITWQPGWELVVFPAMLLAEALLLRRWCSAICPLGFFFGLMAKLRVRLPFLPMLRAKRSTCLYDSGCRTCATVCPEDICDATATQHDLEDCTGCLDCLEHCPAKAITLREDEPTR